MFLYIKDLLKKLETYPESYLTIGGLFKIKV